MRSKNTKKCRAFTHSTIVLKSSKGPPFRKVQVGPSHPSASPLKDLGPEDVSRAWAPRPRTKVTKTLWYTLGMAQRFMPKTPRFPHYCALCPLGMPSSTTISGFLLEPVAPCQQGLTRGCAAVPNGGLRGETRMWAVCLFPARYLGTRTACDHQGHRPTPVDTLVKPSMGSATSETTLLTRGDRCLGNRFKCVFTKPVVGCSACRWSCYLSSPTRDHGITVLAAWTPRVMGCEGVVPGTSNPSWRIEVDPRA